MAAKRSDWSDHESATLARLWFDPTLSTWAIHRQIRGKSYEAIVAQAARMGYPTRTEVRGELQYVHLKGRGKPLLPQKPKPLRPGQRTLPLLPSELEAQGAQAAE